MRASETPVSQRQNKAKTDVVTAADRTAQRAVADRIKETFPNDTIYGEEGTTATAISETGRTWVIDPIDGTNNHVRGNRRWTTSVACLVNGQVVTAVNILPMMGDTYVATTDGVYRNGEQVSVSDRVDMDCFRVVPTFWWGFERRIEFTAVTKSIIQLFSDMHRIGSTQAALSLLSAGSFEGVITNVMTNPWDTIAGGSVQISMNNEAVCFLSALCPKTHASAEVSTRST
ncbi:Archaeal fructose-1,6-bisphosphatase or related enzyme of inositol monophosphatase family (plasmid) [Halapricum desulfuricans]|uniref:fructose-bisphosphatase n=1 Tax=Halapricum desulfuricans TaxID=2841257 RepID=A0A897P001_9EURY|nr:Archaeal fructose-1,6-bisphosphatase or related enzyme of inositol monophosphatase family [Halapricum desulfuricans]